MAQEFGETLYAYLERRERELEAQLAVWRSGVQSRETELAHVQSAKRQIGNLGSNDKAKFGLHEIFPPEEGSLLTRLYPAGPQNVVELVAAAALSGAEAQVSATIKELIVRALHVGFPDGGATVSDLKQFIANAFGRNIHPSSISPQLSRLKADSLLNQNEGDRWYLTDKGRAHARYLAIHHPTSRAAVKELQDDDVQPGTETLRFRVIKAFKSVNQHFREGTILEFKHANFDAFKKSIRPLDFNDLVGGGFIKAIS